MNSSLNSSIQSDAGEKPVAAEPLGYRAPVDDSRSLLMPTIGWISLILGLAGMVWGATMIAVSLGVLWSAIALPIAAPPPVLYTAPMAAAHRVSAVEGKAIVDGLSRKLALDPARRTMLERLVLECGDRYVIDVGADPTPEKVADNITETGPLFGEDGMFAVIGQTRLELTGARASLERLPITEPRTRIEVGANGAGSQATGLSNVFSFLRASSSGNESVAAGPTADELFAARAAALQRGLAAMSLQAGDGVISIILSVLLLVAAVATLRQRRVGRSLHLIWASLKIPLACASGLILWISLIVIPQLGTALPASMTVRRLLMAGLVVHLVVGWVYAIVVLLLMQTRLAEPYAAQAEGLSRGSTGVRSAASK